MNPSSGLPGAVCSAEACSVSAVCSCFFVGDRQPTLQFTRAGMIGLLEQHSLCLHSQARVSREQDGTAFWIRTPKVLGCNMM